MPNAFVTPQNVTREALRILHQKLFFVKNVNTQYDDRFKVNGAKAGTDLVIRLPNKFTTRNGMTYSAQDVVEETTTLARSTVKGIDLNFTSMELQSRLDDVSKRILEPAMSQLAATIEADVCQSWLDVPNVVGTIGSPMTFLTAMQARKRLTDNLAPPDSQRTFLMDTQANVDMVDALKGLFNDSSTISEQYSEGMMGRTAGFRFYESTITGGHTSGTALSVTTYVLNGVPASGATTAVVATGATTFKRGDIFTIAGVFDVHAETKAVRPGLKQFTVAADYAGGAGTISFSPALNYTANGRQNVSAAPANGAAITKVGGASAVYNSSLAFHKDAFVFTTADLPLPKGTDWAYQETYDGITLSIVRDFDINTRDFKTRMDVLYGYKCVRPELACRVLAN